MTNNYALYPANENLRSLHPNESYTMSFSSKPLLEDVGFCSVTIYYDNGLMIESPLDRYVIGDHSNLQYPNVDPVYGKVWEGGHFDILIQGAEPARN